MKRKLYLTAIALIALVACNDRLSTEEEIPEGYAKLSLSFKGGETKSVGTSNENRIANVQIFAFDDTGKLEVYKQEKYKNQTVLSSTSSYIFITPGSKKIVTIANAPDLTVETYEELKGKTSYLADNGTSALVMVGEAEADVEEGGTNEVSIPIIRIASRIRITSITNNLNKHFNMYTLTITNVYLINAVGSTGYFEDQEPENWYNMMKWENKDDNVSRFLIKNSSFSSTTINNSSDLSSYPLYTYPNDTETNSYDQETWCPRYTRLVVEASLNQSTYYYPISIPNIERNTAYDIELTITRPGSLLPDVPVDDEIMDVNITINDWNDDIINETI